MWVCGTTHIRSVLVWTSWRRWLIQTWPRSSPHPPPWCFSPRCCRGSTGSVPGTVPPIQVASPALASPGRALEAAGGSGPLRGQVAGQKEICARWPSLDPAAFSRPPPGWCLTSKPPLCSSSHWAHVSLNGSLPPLIPPLHSTRLWPL